MPAPNALARVGLIVGRERSFPEALIAELSRRDVGVVGELATVDITFTDDACPYAVLVDRISHEIPAYQAWLKHAAMHGAQVVNDPFFRTVDDKFLDVFLAQQLGVAAPRTALLPSKAFGSDITAGSLRNLRYPLSWERAARELGFPMYVKPHWGGGWRDVHRVGSMDELFARYDASGTATLIAQEEVRWEQYVRCVVIGCDRVLPALWNPTLPHHERYIRAAETMPALSPALEARVEREARALCSALGYEMNTVEFAVRDGVPYAIDFMNSAPDFDIGSLGEPAFTWVVGAMADLVIGLARTPRPLGLARGRYFAPAPSR